MDPLVRVALPVLRWPAAERALELVVEARLGVGKPPGLPLALDIVPSMLGPTPTLFLLSIHGIRHI
jgi:hypothetical protein